MSQPAAIGLDIGGTKTLCLLTNEKLNILSEIKFKTAGTLGQRHFVSELIRAIKNLKKSAKKKGLKLVGVGIGFAGHVDTKKVAIKAAPNILALENLAVGKTIQQAVGLESVIDNDVRLGVYAEQQHGAAKGCAHVLGVFFGTGVGGAAIIDGRLYEGASGFGGQVGCILAQPVGGPAAAQSHGIVDRIASKASIAAEAMQMAMKNWAPYLHKKANPDLSKFGWGLLRKSIENGDQRVEEMLRARMQVVGIALSNVVNFFNPEMLVLGGGLTDELSKLVVTEVADSLQKHLVPEVAEALKIKAAKLGSQAVAIGAAKLALVELG